MGSTMADNMVEPHPPQPARLLMTRSGLATILVSLVVWSATIGAQGSSTQAPPTALTLEQALQYALDHYPTVRAALEQVNASTANVSGPLRKRPLLTSPSMRFIGGDPTKLATNSVCGLL